VLSDRYLSVMGPVSDVGVLWPNGSTDQDASWYAGRYRPRPYCVRRGPRFPHPKGTQLHHLFSAHVCCGQTAGWIKIPIGVEVGLGIAEIVLDGDPALPCKGWGELKPPIFGPCLLWRNGRMDQEATWYGKRTT